MKATNILGVIIIFFLSCNPDDNTKMLQLEAKYCNTYEAFNIPALRIKYLTNLALVKSLDSIRMQEEFFTSMLQKVKLIDRNKLQSNLKMDYDLMLYESNLNLERLHLEEKFINLGLNSIPEKGLINLDNGKKWYIYFLKKWLGDDVDPDQIFQFGLAEITKVKKEIMTIQESSNMDSISFYNFLKSPHFFHMDTSTIEQAIELTKLLVQVSYKDQFPYTDSIPPLKIKHSNNERAKLAPAYYQNATFYYSFFGEPFNRRLTDVFFLHEGLPGHHYQLSVDRMLDRAPIRKLSSYLGFLEGWAAYVEEIGKELGAYRNEYDYFGKWEWGLVRSVRVCLDVGINYYGWDKEKASAFWKSHIPNQDHIMDRELKRMRLQPAQVITYKYGGHQILKWKKNEMKKPGYNPKSFHKKVLENGSLPFYVLKKQFGEE